MAVNFPNNVNARLNRSATTLSTTTFSIGVWARFASTTNARTVWALENASSGYLVLEQTATALSLTCSSVGGDVTTPFTVSANTWYFFGVSYSSGSGTLYIGTGNPGSALTARAISGGATFNTTFSLGANVIAGEALSGPMAGVRVWNGIALSASDWETERRFLRAVTRRDALWAEYPLTNVTGSDHLRDYSGAGLSLTAGSTAVTADANHPPVSWGPSPASYVLLTGAGTGPTGLALAPALGDVPPGPTLSGVAGSLAMGLATGATPPGPALSGVATTLAMGLATGVTPGGPTLSAVAGALALAPATGATLPGPALSGVAAALSPAPALGAVPPGPALAGVAGALALGLATGATPGGPALTALAGALALAPATGDTPPGPSFSAVGGLTPAPAVGDTPPGPALSAVAAPLALGLATGGALPGPALVAVATPVLLGRADGATPPGPALVALAGALQLGQVAPDSQPGPLLSGGVQYVLPGFTVGRVVAGQGSTGAVVQGAGSRGVVTAGGTITFEVVKQ